MSSSFGCWDRSRSTASGICLGPAVAPCRVYSPMGSGLLTGAMTRERMLRCRKTTGESEILTFGSRCSQAICDSSKGCSG